MSRRRVIVVGDVMLDVIAKPLTRVASTSDTPASVHVGRGGAAANMAAALAESGHEVVFVGACGDDAARTIFTQALSRDGVEVRLQVTPGVTGTVVAVVADDAQRAMFTDRGANSSLTEAFVLAQLEDPFDHVHVSGYTLLDAATRAAGASVLRRARERGRPSSVDVCSVGPLSHVTPEVFLTSAREASMLFANEEEALALAGEADVDAALAILRRSFSDVMVTRGPEGALAVSGTEVARSRSLSDLVLDTTGAGDAATGAFLGARLHGANLDEALTLAMQASARVVRALGARAD